MIDYLMDENDDLRITGGDFTKGYSNKQHQRSLLLAEKGDYKQAPIATVGLASYLNDDSPAEMMREIRLRFSDDGMTVQQLGYEGAKLKIAADYGG
jgi:hypothetical protein